MFVVACGGAETRSLDGGLPLDFDARPSIVEHMTNDPCWRQEKGGWHYSVGHCEVMSAARPMIGIYVTGFEERSFFPDQLSIPEPNDPRRFTYEIELDEADVERLGGPIPGHPYGDAYLLSFIGRRTSDPWHVDCFGTPYFTVVVDRLLAARHLGPMGRFRWDMERRPPTVARRHSGRWGELEAEAMRDCLERHRLRGERS